MNANSTTLQPVGNLNAVRGHDGLSEQGVIRKARNVSGRWNQWAGLMTDGTS